MVTDAHKLATTVKTLARQLDFDLVGITSAEPLPQAGQNLLQTVKSGFTAGMSYLQRNPLSRAQPKSLAPWARSVICVGINYYSGPLSQPTAKSQVRLSRYALGRDYHLVLSEKLTLFSQALEKLLQRKIRSRMAVDTSPLMEKPLAQRAHLGWQGKNTLLINKKFGSWIFLGELLTDLDLAVDLPCADQCGDCRVCIDACPTGALSEPGVLDARKCLSFLTIEHKDEIPAVVLKKIQTNKETGRYCFGCDICQEVCPFNRDTPQTAEKRFYPRPEFSNLRLDQLKQISEPQFKDMFSDTPVIRLSYQQFRRNLHLIKQ